jgi:hypothetical protein
MPFGVIPPPRANSVAPVENYRSQEPPLRLQGWNVKYFCLTFQFCSKASKQYVDVVFGKNIHGWHSEDTCFPPKSPTFDRFRWFSRFIMTFMYIKSYISTYWQCLPRSLKGRWWFLSFASFWHNVCPKDTSMKLYINFQISTFLESGPTPVFSRASSKCHPWSLWGRWWMLEVPDRSLSGWKWLLHGKGPTFILMKKFLEAYLHCV